MPNCRKPRKKYRPKGVLPDPMSYVMKGFVPIAQVGDEAVKLKIKAYDALNNIREGRGEFKDVDQVVAAMNVCEALALGGEIGKEYAAEIRAGQDALFAMAQRGADTGRFLFTGPELVAVNEAMEIHAAQMDIVTVAELQTALQCVVKLTRTGKARKVGAAA